MILLLPIIVIIITIIIILTTTYHCHVDDSGRVTEQFPDLSEVDEADAGCEAASAKPSQKHSFL